MRKEQWTEDIIRLSNQFSTYFPNLFLMYEFATSLFNPYSNTAIEINGVFQSRYVVSATKLIALFWLCSQVDKISTTDPHQDNVQHTIQNTL
jgi:hypothetical protein